MNSLRAASSRVIRPGAGPRVPRQPPAAAPDCVVDCAVYVDGRRLPGSWSHADALAEVRDRGAGFVWIGLYSPDARQIADIASTYALHELAVEDAVHGHQRPKLEHYDDHLFMVLKTVTYVEHESPETTNEIVASGEVMVFLGSDFVVTVRRGPHSRLGTVRQDLERTPDMLRLGPASVLHAIADFVVDTYLDVTDRIESDVDIVEERVFSASTRVSAEQIYMMKHEITELRRAVVPLATPLRRLTEGHGPFVPDAVRPYFRNVDDHLTTVAERVNAYDDLLGNLVTAAMAKISLQQNTDMRKISAWVAIVAVPTMIAGIYGMNFEHMPELRWRYGYLFVWIVIIVSCVGLHRVFRRNRWL